MQPEAIDHPICDGPQPLDLAQEIGGYGRSNATSAGGAGAASVPELQSEPRASLSSGASNRPAIPFDSDDIRAMRALNLSD